jgi:hypothetical protein
MDNHPKRRSARTKKTEKIVFRRRYKYCKITIQPDRKQPPDRA